MINSNSNSNSNSNLFRVFDRGYGTVKEYFTSQNQAEQYLQWLEFDRSQPVSNIGRYSIAAPSENIYRLSDSDIPCGKRYVTIVA